MPMLPEKITSFPADFHGFKLIRWLGGGYMSDAYMAATPPKSGLPEYIALKIATDKLAEYPGQYTQESVEVQFAYQRRILNECRQPFIIRCYDNVLSEVPDVLATALGVTSLEFLQQALDMGTKSHEHNQFAPVVVKYFAAQIFLAVAHLHGKGYFWGDPKQANIVVMSDFTLRIIDVGEITMTPARNFKDFCFVAAMINNMITSSSDSFVNHPEHYYKPLVESYQTEIQADLYDLLQGLLKKVPYKDLLGHTYWASMIDEDPRTKLDLLNLEGSKVAKLNDMREAAWNALPQNARTWLIEKGVEDIGTFQHE